MNYCIINGRQFDATVAITELSESFDVLDGDNVGRAKSGLMIRDIIGTYIGHKVTFQNTGDNDSFDALWNYLVECSINDSVTIEMADGQSSISYEAYYTSGERTLKQAADGVNYWDKISVSFISMDAQVKP